MRQLQKVAGSAFLSEIVDAQWRMLPVAGQETSSPSAVPVDPADSTLNRDAKASYLVQQLAEPPCVSFKRLNGAGFGNSKFDSAGSSLNSSTGCQVH